jgi:pilus assembly protein Flp/PilA
LCIDRIYKKLNLFFPEGDGMRKRIERLAREEDGQGMGEYGRLLALIAVGAIATLLVLGPKIKDQFTAVLNNLATS